MVSSEQLVGKIQEHLPGAEVRAMDLTGGGDHWQLRIRAPQFEGKSLVEQHQMVYAALGSWMHREIHALSLDTGSV